MLSPDLLPTNVDWHNIETYVKIGAAAKHFVGSETKNVIEELYKRASENRFNLNKYKPDDNSIDYNTLISELYR